MRAAKAWALAFALLSVAIMAASDVNCALADRETAASNSAIGYVPSAWRQTSHADFLRGVAAGAQVNVTSDSVSLKARYTDPGVYVLIGGASPAFYRYNITSRAWSAMASLPVVPADGSAMVHDGSGHIYALAGGSSAALHRYDVLANAWTWLTASPAGVGSGGDITWDGTCLYVMGGASGRQVWRLDMASLAWTQVTTVPNQTGIGASMLCSGGYLYVTRGGDGRDFWRYDLSTGKWTALARTGARVGAGSDLIAGPGGALYVSLGSNGRQLASYNVAANAWTALSAQPYAVGYGGGLTYGGSDTIYSINGDGKRHFYSYNRTLNSWAQLARLPAAVGSGGCLVYVPSVLTGFPPSGTLISETFDTGAAGARYVQAFWDRTAPASTAATIEARASDSLSGGAPAAAWLSLGNGTSGTMSGLSGRYVQWKVTLATADAYTTPELQEVRIYYYRA